jgi:proteic killer suppression protein
VGHIHTCTYSVNILYSSVIIDFGDQTTSDIFHGLDTRQARKIPNPLWGIAVRKLDMVNAAHELNDLRVPPANRLKPLRGRLSGYYPIRINDQYRVIFQWVVGNAKSVKITDYH